MDRHLIDRLEEFVKNEGFSQIDILRSSNAHTLSAVKDESRLVVHLTEGVAVPLRAEALHETPSELIAVRPVVPGITEAITGSPAKSGGGGAVAGGAVKERATEE